MKDCRVLVIEDELLIGLDVVWTLESAGFGYVEHAMSETDALSLIRTHAWHAIVADANLNGRGIEQVVLLLREKKLPFLVVTGYSRENLSEVVGEATVLTKPFSNYELVCHVQKLCRLGPQEPVSTPC